MSDWIKILFPAIVTVALNILFYLFIKNRVEKKIEKYKIAYSGVFKERIDVYRKLLELTHIAKTSIVHYQFKQGEEVSKSIMKNLNNMNDFVKINEPFISTTMIDNIKKLHKDYQEIFEPMFMYDRTIASTEAIKKFFESVNKLRKNEELKKLEDAIVLEMRKDLGTE